MHKEWVSKGGVKQLWQTGNKRVKRKLVAMGLKSRKNSGEGVKEKRPTHWQNVNSVTKGLNKPEANGLKKRKKTSGKGLKRINQCQTG